MKIERFDERKAKIFDSASIGKEEWYGYNQEGDLVFHKSLEDITSIYVYDDNRKLLYKLSSNGYYEYYDDNKRPYQLDDKGNKVYI